MIEHFKQQLAAKIRHKEIALVMIVDRGGHIRWHHGRAVQGRTVQDGGSFSRTHLLEVLGSGDSLAQQDVVITNDEESLPQSARLLLVRSLFIHPIDDDLVLYVDSGNDSFDKDDIDFFRDNSAALRGLLQELRATEARQGGIIGDSTAAQQIRDQVLLYALEEEPVLILGETGAGKSHVAQLLHRFSGRRGQLIIVDTPALPESLIESELFGHVKGAFTGAVADRKGLVDAADGGTLFLDEIAEVPLALQAKLLRFIDTRRFRAVGDTRERSVATRIIAATNRNLEEEISRQRFREDLYFRLNVLTIEIPSLRQRPDDIPALVREHERFLRGKTLAEGFWREVLAHDWPGNVRELINVMKRAGIQHPGPEIGAEIGQLLARRSGRGPARTDDDRVTQLRAAIDSGEPFWENAWAAFLERDINRHQLKALLAGYFAASQHSLRQLAQHLNIDEAHYPRFVSALHKYRVHPGQ